MASGIQSNVDVDEQSNQPSTSGLLNADAGDDGSNFGVNYGEYFDAEQFVQDGNDICFQLPSHNPDINLTKRLDKEQLMTTVRRRKTVIKRRPTATTAPTIEQRGTKSDIALLKSYDAVDSSDRKMTAQEQYRELQCVRSLTRSMGVKRKYRDTIQSCECVRPEGFTLARHRAIKRLNRIRNNLSDFSAYTGIWKGTLREIEGQFGAGIMEYFRLVKWMIFLNLLLAIITLFILLPQIVFSPKTFEEKFQDVDATISYNSSVSGEADPLHHEYGLALQCSRKYSDALKMRGSPSWYQYMFDFVQGTGIFENTILFYGYYFNKTANISPSGLEAIYPWYNMSVAYLVVTMVFFIVSLLFIVSSTSTGLQNNLFANDVIMCKAINQVFAGWDFGLYKEKSALVKHSLIRHEIMRDMAEERRQIQYKNRSAREHCQLYCKRIVVNTFVILVLSGCGVAIYYTQEKARVELANENMAPFAAFVWQYLPSVLITVMYAAFPPIFLILSKWEQYYPATQLNINIARIVLLRLATVFLLLTPIYVEVMSCERQACGNCKNIPCWETFIGQQLYKLVLLDFFVIAAVVAFVEFPRKFIWDRFNHVRLVQLIGQEEFDIPVNVMDVVYTQTLCWIGAFFSPLIPIITLVKVFFFFYLRKLSLFRNQRPSDTPYRASNTDLFFMFVLTISFFLGILAVGISVGVISPSRGCGPFRVRSSVSVSDDWTMFEAITEAMLNTPVWFQDTIKFLVSPSFQVSLIVVLSLVIYFYSALSTAQTRLVQLLRDTLKLEEKDKHWLLNKVNINLVKELNSSPNRR